MLLKNNKNSRLFYTLLGDYYLYMYNYTNRSDFINNSTSMVIHQLFDETSINISSSWFLKGGNKYIKLGKVVLKEDNINVFDLNGNIINNVELLYVLNEEEDVFFNISKNTNEVVKLMEKQKINESICYFTTNEFYLTKKESKFFFNVDDIDLTKIISYVIYKLIHFSITNSKLVNNIISIFFGVPYCISSKEKIVNIEDNIIKTDKNIYQKKHSNIISYNKDVVFGEPLYYISYIKNKNNPILKNIYRKKMFMDGYSNRIYLKRFHNYIKKTFLNAIIDIDVIIESPYKASSLAKILHNIKFIDTDLNGEKNTNNTNEILSNSSFNLIEDNIVNCSEKFILTTNYYKTDNVFNVKTKKTDGLFLIKKESIETKENSKQKGFIIKNNAAGIQMKDIDKKYINDKTILNEHTIKTGKKIEFVLKAFNEDIKNTILNKDDVLYKQNEMLSYYHMDKDNILSAPENSLLNINLKKQDNMLLPEDSIFLNMIKKESVGQSEKIIEKGEEAHKESLNYIENNIYKKTEEDIMGHKDKYKTKHKLERSLLRTRDEVSSFSKTIKIENIGFKDKDSLKSIINDVLINRDKLEVESDTNIDKI